MKYAASKPTTLWALCLVLACAPGAAEETLHVSATHLAATVDVIPEPWRVRTPPLEFDVQPPLTEPENPFSRLRFRDQQPLVNRLRRLQAVPFVTVWDSRDATLYLGVNRDGETGLHLRQKRDDRGVRARKVLIAERDPLAAPDTRKSSPPRATPARR